MDSNKASSPSIVIVSNLYPNKFEKTRGLFIKQLTDSLATKLRVTVVSPVPFNPLDLIKPSSKRLPESEIIDGITVFHPRYIVIPKLFRSLTGFFFSIGIKQTLKTLSAEGKADFISAHWVYPDGFGANRIAKQLNIPIAIHALGCDINEYTKFKIRRKLITQALKQSDVNIVKSHELKNKIDSLGVDTNKTKVIHNGVDQKKFIRQKMAAARKTLNLNSADKYCLFVGNFQIEKGLNYLVSAFKLIQDENVKLLVIGSGPLEADISQQVESLGLTDKIKFVGRVSHEMIPTYLSAANLLCLPSLREGCPNVVLESLSCGTPVVASDVGAVRDIISKPEFGVVVQPQDPDALAEGINKGLRLDKDTMPLFEWYDWAENADRIMQEFNRVNR